MVSSQAVNWPNISFLVDNELTNSYYQCNYQPSSPVSALPLQVPGSVGTSMVFPLLSHGFNMICVHYSAVTGLKETRNATKKKWGG